MLINLTELFSIEGKEKAYTVAIDMERLQAPGGAYFQDAGGIADSESRK